MTTLAALEERIALGETIIMDGAMGTELQRRGVPMDANAWSAPALLTHTEVVRELHEDYIRAGAEVIITNSFSAARHLLEAASLGDMVRETNSRSVKLALEARESTDSEKPVYVAGSISTAVHAADRDRLPPAAIAEENYREQAEILAEGGVDLLVLEMMRDIEYCSAAVRAAAATGLPTWVGFSCRMADDGSTVLLLSTDDTLERALEVVMPLGGSLVSIMHSATKVTGPALEVVRRHWSGPMGAYAESGGWRSPNSRGEGLISTEEYLSAAQRWVSQGTQVVGGCCGLGPEYVRALREGIPSTAG
jgi:S-methylmethionine-dependent homocysteine/selenocysteine methylase